MYNFSEDWFSEHIPVWEKVMVGFKDQPATFLEIGSYEGRSATWLLDNILTHADSRLYCVDSFVGGVEHHVTNEDYKTYERNMSFHKGKVVTLRGRSQDVLRTTLVKSKLFEVIYIDGDHFPETVLEDAVLSWPLLKYGGIMIFDDYKWKGFSDHHAPKNGIDAFLHAYGNLLVAIHADKQVIIRKKLPNELDKVNYANHILTRLTLSENSISATDTDALRLEYTKALYELNNLDVMLMHCDILLKKSPENTQAYQNKIACYLKKGAPKDAMKTIEDASKAGVNPPEFMAEYRRLEALLDAKEILEEKSNE